MDFWFLIQDEIVNESFASIKLIEQLRLGLLQVMEVNLIHFALTIKGNEKTSRYKKLQRFFSKFEIFTLGLPGYSRY